jgi:L-fuculose-phosphate aldolase
LEVFVNHLHFSAYATERDLRLAILEAGRLCYNSGLMTANNGNLSARLGDDRIVITPKALCKGRLEAEDLLVVDMEGNVLKADPRRRRQSSSETPMHLEVYRQRPDVRAVLHAHPAYATAMTVADIPFPDDILPEVLEVLGPVPTSRFAMPSSDDNALAIRDLLTGHNAVLIRQHGAIAFGQDLDEALIHMERLEHVARTVMTAYAAGKVNRLPEEMLTNLRALAQKPPQ